MGEAATDMVHAQTDTTENDTTQPRRVEGGGGLRTKFGAGEHAFLVTHPGSSVERLFFS